jgi:hypothetical protein
MTVVPVMLGDSVLLHQVRNIFRWKKALGRAAQ